MSRLAPAALWASLLALAASLSLQKIRSLDYWWQLRTGELIAESGAVPRIDPFTYTVPGARWIDIHWLHQLGLHAVHSLGGHAGVVLAIVALVLLLLGILAPIGFRRARPAVSVAALALMLLAACDRFMPRPELPTFVLLALVLALLDRFRRRGDARVYAIIAVQLVWVNVHGLFALGIAACALSLAAELLRPVAMPRERLRPERVRRLAIVTGLAALAALANPNGLDGALYPLTQLRMIGAGARDAFGALVNELAPSLASNAALTPLAIAVAVALAGASLAAMALNWRRLDGADPLMWGAFLCLALAAHRNRALFAIVAAPILVRNLNAFLDGIRWRPSPRSATAGVLALSVVLLGLGVDAARGRLLPRLGPPREPGLGVAPDLHPVGAVDWISREQPPAPICHHMVDGGYLIWRLHPRYRVMTDGRLEVFGPERFMELLLTGPERFRDLDARFGCGVVLVHFRLVESRELLWWLQTSPDWQLMFVDETAALFVRSVLGPSPWPTVDVDAPNLFPPLDDPVGRRDLARRFARMKFLSALRRNKTALRLWNDTVQRYPGDREVRTAHAMLLYQNGRIPQGDAALTALLAEHPDDARLQSRAARLRAQLGDLPGATRLYDAALALEPGRPEALWGRAQLAEARGNAQTARGLYERLLDVLHASDPQAIATAERLQALSAATPSAGE